MYDGWYIYITYGMTLQPFARDGFLGRIFRSWTHATINAAWTWGRNCNECGSICYGNLLKKGGCVIPELVPLGTLEKTQSFKRWISRSMQHITWWPIHCRWWMYIRVCLQVQACLLGTHGLHTSVPDGIIWFVVLHRITRSIVIIVSLRIHWTHQLQDVSSRYLPYVTDILYVFRWVHSRYYIFRAYIHNSLVVHIPHISNAIIFYVHIPWALRSHHFNFYQNCMLFPWDYLYSLYRFHIQMVAR